MKTKFFMLICATVLCSALSAQKITLDKVPAPVASAFKSKYPAVTHANWMMENGGKNYAAEFMVNTSRQTASFNPAGGWLKTDTSIKTTEIPAVVKETITKQFAGYTLGSASKMENADHATGFDVALTKGKDVVDVTLSAKGVVMSQEARPAEPVMTK